MIRKFAINCISDEIHHPQITKFYRLFLILNVFAALLLLFYTNKINHQETTILVLQISFNFFLLFDFILRIIGSFEHLDMENYDEFFSHKYSLKKYLFSYYGVVDFFSIFPLFMLLFKIGSSDILTLLTLITLLKLSRFSPALVVLKDVIVSERDALFASLYMMIIITFSLSTTLYFIERDVNPGFASLFDALWWSIITLSTVGYGDVTPMTSLGKLVGGIAAISGFGMFALPAGILASGFAAEVKRLKNITTWKMVSSVSLFKELEFGAIADISKMLHIKRYRKGEKIIQEGADGDAMYFILKGSVLVYNNSLKTILKSGDFFGEIALLKDIPRTATVETLERCELLELTTYDFKNFIKTKPELAKQIEKTALQRYKNK